MGGSAIELALSVRCNNLAKENKELRLTNQRLEAENEKLSKALCENPLADAERMMRIEALEAEVESMTSILTDVKIQIDKGYLYGSSEEHIRSRLRELESREQKGERG